MVANEAHCAELAITISYPTSASGILNCFIKNAQRIAIFAPAVFVDAYTYHICGPCMVYELIYHACPVNPS